MDIMHHTGRRSKRRKRPPRPRQPALRPREARLRMLAEHSPDIYFSMRFPEGRYEYISPTVQDIFGRAPQEFYDDPATVVACIAPEWREKVRAWLADIARGQVAEAYEFEVLDKLGRRRFFRQRQVFVPTPDGRAWLLQGVATDVTELRQAQQLLTDSEERFRQLIELWPDQVTLSVNLDAGRHEYVSPSMERVMGYAPQEFYDDPGLGLAVVAPQWREQARIWLAEIAAGVLRPCYEFELVHKSGQHRFIHQVGVLRPPAPGQDRVVHFTFRDITEQRRAERALQESEARYRALAESWEEQVVLRFNLRTSCLEYVSPSVKGLFGYAPEEFYARAPRAMEAMLPPWRPVFHAWLKELRRGLLRPEYEVEVLDAWGRQRWVLARCTLLGDDPSQPAALQAVLLDNTERRRLEDALRESNRLHALLSDNMVDVIWSLDPALRWTYLTPSAETLTGRPVEELYRLGFETIFSPASLLVIADALERWRLARPGSPEDGPSWLNLELRHADGSLIAVEALARPLRDAAGTITGYCGTTRDIRLRKRQEAVEAALSGLARELLECEVLSQSLDLAAACAARLTGAGRGLAAHRDPEGGLFLCADGSPLPEPLPGEALFAPVLHAGEEVGRLGVLAPSLEAAEARPLLERVADLLALALARLRAEGALRKSERMARLLLESMHEGVWAADREQRTIFVNEHLAAMLGYSVPELMAMRPSDVLPLSQRQLALERLQERRLGFPGSAEYEVLCKNGRRLPLHVTASPILDEQGGFEGLVCTAVNLAERQQLERELRRNQARFEALFELSRLASATEAQMAAFTLREALRLTSSTAGALFFADPEGGMLVPLAWDGAPGSAPAPAIRLDGPTPFSHVCRHRAPLVLNELGPYRRHLPQGHLPVERFLGVPALDGERAAAVLGLTGKAADYTDEDSMQVSLLLDGMWRIVRGRRDAERIRSSLSEKEALLREVHHRVKNNLQVVSSLLDMAARRLSQPEARRSLEEVRAKVQAMSLVHAQLHGDGAEGAGAGRGIDLERYVAALFRQLREIYSGDMELGLKVRLDRLALGLEQAAPLGLALNEVLANAFKHGRREGQPGRVDVRAWQEADGRVRIEVRDDGPGLPEGLAPERASGLGLKLLFGLVRNQLGGEVDLDSDADGVCVRLGFRPHIVA